jgi:hypothetical protein
MELKDIGRELFECLTARIYSPQVVMLNEMAERERAAIEAYLDLEGDESDGGNTNVFD